MRAATPRLVDLSFNSLLYGPEKTWPKPQTFEQIAAQAAIRSARAQRLTDRIEHPGTVRKLAVLLRTR